MEFVSVNPVARQDCKSLAFIQLDDFENLVNLFEFQILLLQNGESIVLTSLAILKLN